MENQLPSDDLNLIRQLLIADVKRRLFEESTSRIKQCLQGMSEDAIWHQWNDNTVSVGNLVLHLHGNVRQWILSGLGGQPDDRERPREFMLSARIPKQTLFQLLEELQQDVESYLDNMPAQVISQDYNIQGIAENGLSVLIHVVEHFSYHTGQITLLYKLHYNVATDYYDEGAINE